MSTAVPKPLDLLTIACDVVMHGTCTHRPVCVVIECVFEDENGRSVIARRAMGPAHAVIGQSSDPTSFMDPEKVLDFYFPEPVSDEGNKSNSDGDEDEDEDEVA